MASASPVRAGIDAVRQNWRPFVLIQVAAALLAIAYYASPRAQAATIGIEMVKSHGGLGFSAAATAFAGAVLPEVARRVTTGSRSTASDLAFQAVFFSIIGVIIDLLYQGLGVVFGQDHSVATVVKKVLFDQFVFSPLVSIPFSTVAFTWRDAGLDLSATRSLLQGGGFLRRFAPLMVTCWGFWLPVIVVVYAMPSDLQFPMFLCTQAAWSLLLLHISRSHPAPLVATP